MFDFFFFKVNSDQVTVGRQESVEEPNCIREDNVTESGSSDIFVWYLYDILCLLRHGSGGFADAEFLVSELQWCSLLFPCRALQYVAIHS